jgi:hypothetical protein
MRLLVLAAVFLLTTPLAAAAADAPNAHAAYVERRGLIEADARCRLFSPGIRSALEAGAAQARGALLRAGWSTGQVRELENAVVAAAGGRACDDARTIAAAEAARIAFSNWTSAAAMDFPGWERSWTARRVTGADGWRLRQAIDTPMAAAFGVRERNGEQRLVLVTAFAWGQRAPISAQLVMRDSSRFALEETSLPQRISFGLEAGAPAPGAASTFAAARSVELVQIGRSQVVFSFPDAAFRTLLSLDPRESVELRVREGRNVRRLFVEVGDIAAARTFLTVRAD